MTDTLAIILSTGLVTTGVVAELNLMRIFVSNRRESCRDQQRRRLRPLQTDANLADASSQISTPRGRPLERAGTRAASIAAAMTTVTVLASTTALAQVNSLSEAPPALVSPTRTDGLILDSSSKLTLTPSTPMQTGPGEMPAEATPFVISTDRPSFSDGTGIQPVGRLNVETGYTFTFRNRDDVETQRHNGPEVLARIGLLEDHLEVRFSTPGYTWSRTDDGSGGGFESSCGWNDVSLGFKLKLLDQNGIVPRFALSAQTTLGVGSDSISNQIAEPTLKLLWSYDLGQSYGDDWKGFTLGGNVNVAWPTTEGDRFTQGQGSVYVSFPLVNRLTGFAEYYVIGPNSKGTDTAHYADFGATYLLNNRVQLDARVGFGLNREADNLFFGVGISFLF